MSVKRYFPYPYLSNYDTPDTDMEQSQDGGWVNFDDYEKLERENADLREKLEKVKLQRDRVVRTAQRLFTFGILPDDFISWAKDDLRSLRELIQKEEAGK